MRRFNNFKSKNRRDTSWQNVAPWYSKLTEKGGHYYHRNVIIPKLLESLSLSPDSKILDLGCGNGVFGIELTDNQEYLGVDLSSSLIGDAKATDKNRTHKYIIADATKKLEIDKDFTHAVSILAVQNMNNPLALFANAASHLVKNGTFTIVLNHPMFRIPRQSAWQIDPIKKLQYRRIDRYMTELKIPVNMNPSQSESEITWSYHFPLSKYIEMLTSVGFVITDIQEWTSDKESEGKASKMENRARNEFPLFMSITAKKS